MSVESPTYAKLQSALAADLILRGQEENEAAKAVYQHVLDAMWPTIQETLSGVSLIINDEFNSTTSVARRRERAEQLAQDGEHVEDWCVVDG